MVHCCPSLCVPNRWHFSLVSLSLGTSHANREDEEYDGYFIPENTFILPLSW